MKRRNESGTVRVPGIRQQMLDEGVILNPGDVPMVDKERLLRNGEPVELNALELPPLACRCTELGLQPFDRVKVLPDDTIVIVALQPVMPPSIDEEEWL